MDLFFGKTPDKNRIFYHVQGQGVLMRQVEGNKLSEAQVLYPHGQPDFDLIYDEDGTTHLVSQDNTGAVYYLKEQGNTFHKHLVLQGKEDKFDEKYFKLVPSGQFLNIFFLIKSKGKCLLSHQMIGNTVLPPQVVDYVLYGRAVYDVVCDPYQNIHLAYLSEKGELHYRMYRWSSKEWGATKVITTNEVAFPQIIFHDDKVNILYVDVKANTAKISTLDKEPLSIFTPFIPLKRPAFFYTPTGLTIQWQQDSKVYSITSMANTSFSSPSRLQNTPSHQLSRTELRFSSPMDGFYGKSCYAQLGTKEIYLFSGKIDLLSGFISAAPSRKPVSPPPTPPMVPTKKSSPPPPPPMPRERYDLPDKSIEFQKLKIQLQTLGDEINKVHQVQLKTLEQLNAYQQTLETLCLSVKPATKRSSTKKTKQEVKKDVSQVLPPPEESIEAHVASLGD